MAHGRQAIGSVGSCRLFPPCHGTAATRPFRSTGRLSVRRRLGPFAVGVHVEGRRFVVDQVLELLAELLERHARGGRELRELVRDPRSRRAAGGSCSGARSRSASSVMSTSRTRVRPVAGSSISLNGIGTKCPPCIEIIAGVAAGEQVLRRAVARGRACTPCRTGSDRRSAARSRCSWRRSSS